MWPRRGRPHVLVAAALSGALLLPPDCGAQRIHDHTVPLQDAGAPKLHDDQSGPSAGGSFLASALLPGAGQYRLGAGRWVVYAGVEVWAWLSYVERLERSSRLEDRYRNLAWSVARRISSGSRREREFEYYEAMSQHRESGAFDADPSAAGLQPESDPSTYNGSVWELARAIFIPADTAEATPGETDAALAYYRENAIEPAFAWSWRGSPLEQQVFDQLIRRSDEMARASTTMLGIVLANHVISAIDALLTARLRDDGDAGRAPQVRFLPYLRHERSAGPALELVLPVF